MKKMKEIEENKKVEKMARKKTELQQNRLELDGIEQKLQLVKIIFYRRYWILLDNEDNNECGENKCKASKYIGKNLSVF